MKIKDERTMNTVPFGMIEEGEMFYCNDRLYLKIPLCYENNIPSLKDVGNMADRRNCVRYVTKSFNFLCYLKEDDMVVPVSSQVTIAEPGCFGD